MGVDMFPVLFPPHLDLPPGLLRDMRKETGRTQTEASHLVHKSLSSWQAWEAGRKIPTDTFELWCIKAGFDFHRAAIDGDIVKKD